MKLRSCYLPKLLKLVYPRRSYSVLHQRRFLRHSVQAVTVCAPQTVIIRPPNKKTGVDDDDESDGDRDRRTNDARD